MKPKRNLISAAVVLAFAAAASPAYAVLERLGPVDNSPSVGGYPSWFQDKTGIAVEFCDLKTAAEHEGGWCVLIPPDATFPESFPDQFFDEHFYYITDGLIDDNDGFRARLVIAMEAAFAVGEPTQGDQIVFGRHRIDIRGLPVSGDYRVITPFDDHLYPGQEQGARLFVTNDIGINCPDFVCALNAQVGPFLLPSATPGGAEVPPMPDLASAPPGTDPWYDQLVAAGTTTPDPGTGKKYLADPARLGNVTGSPLPPFTDGEGHVRDHNIFRIEAYAPGTNLLLFAKEQATFVVSGRLMDKAIPGNVAAPRSTYKGDASGNVIDLDVYAKATSTLPSRMPAQPILPKITPQISFYDQACGGALVTDPATGLLKVGPGPYTAPAGTSHNMAATGNDFWGQSSPGGLPPSHVCIEDATSRNLAGQVVPSYTLVPVTDQITITTAHYVGPENGTLSVNAVSSDPTAVLTLAGYGPGAATTPGVSVGQGAGTGLQMPGGAAQVLAMAAPPSRVQVVSSKGGSSLRDSDTAHGTAVLVGIPSAVNDAATISEDCSPGASLGCAAGQGATLDLLANDTIMLNGSVTTLRNAVSQNLAAVSVTAQAPRLGAATVSADGILTYTPNPNAFGTDNVNYTVTVDGNVSNQAVVSINITPVNDNPVAGTVTIGAVAGKLNVMNLLTNATDPDGAGDVTNAVITSWPAELGVQPTPVNGVISFTPSVTGNRTIGFTVTDAAGATSGNIGTGTATVIAVESISAPANLFTISKTRWVISGTDTVRANQTLTIAYTDGQLRTGGTCNGTASIAGCVIATVKVDGTGAYNYDSTAVTGSANPVNNSLWLVRPRNMHVFSSSPNLGGVSTSATVSTK
jgi:hypothetical protein